MLLLYNLILYSLCCYFTTSSTILYVATTISSSSSASSFPSFATTSSCITLCCSNLILYSFCYYNLILYYILYVATTSSSIPFVATVQPHTPYVDLTSSCITLCCNNLFKYSSCCYNLILYSLCCYEYVFSVFFASYHFVSHNKYSVLLYCTAKQAKLIFFSLFISLRSFSLRSKMRGHPTRVRCACPRPKLPFF